MGFGSQWEFGNYFIFMHAINALSLGKFVNLNLMIPCAHALYKGISEANINITNLIKRNLPKY